MMKHFIVCGRIIFYFVLLVFVKEEMFCGNSFFQKEADQENIYQKDKFLGKGVDAIDKKKFSGRM